MRKYRNPDGGREYEVRQLNSSKRGKASKVQILNPDSVDIHKSHQDLDVEIMTRCITREDLEKIWNCSIDDTVSDEKN